MTDFHVQIINKNHVRVSAISKEANDFLLKNFTFNNGGEYVEFPKTKNVSDHFRNGTMLGDSGLTYKII